MLTAIVQARCPLHHRCKGTLYLTNTLSRSSIHSRKASLRAKFQRKDASINNNLRFHRAGHCSWTRQRIVSEAGSRAYVFSSDAEDDDIADPEGAGDGFLDAVDEDLDTGADLLSTVSSTNRS